MTMKGDARRWAARQPVGLSWITLRTKFLSAFAKIDVAEKRAELYRRKQGKETVER